MIFPFGVEFHPDQWLIVWRPRGLFTEEMVTDVIAAPGQLEAELGLPFNRFWVLRELRGLGNYPVMKIDVFQ